MGTYSSVVRPDGSLHGVGQGVVMTSDGEMATWRGEGVGRFTGRGTAVSSRGAVYYQTASPELVRLNRVATLFEYEVDENGKTQAKLWEWTLQSRPHTAKQASGTACRAWLVVVRR